MRIFASMVVALIFCTGCNKYIIYETPYCIESIIIPPPKVIQFNDSHSIDQIPCSTRECKDFIVKYQQREIQTYESISNWIGESKLRIEQYERRVKLCQKANIKTQELIHEKQLEVGEGNVTVKKIDIENVME
ncbi:MAG: hypothetical protein AB2794_13255 [Candidatus Thiodiazotropha endolucinida]